MMLTAQEGVWGIVAKRFDIQLFSVRRHLTGSLIAEDYRGGDVAGLYLLKVTYYESRMPGNVELSFYPLYFIVRYAHETLPVGKNPRHVCPALACQDGHSPSVA
jgi:hypothetical protein